MKKLKIFLATCALAVFLPFLPTKVAEAGEHPVVNIKLQNFLGNKAQIPIKIKGTYNVENDGTALRDGIDYTLKMESGKIKLYNGSTLIKDFGVEGKISPSTYGTSNFIYINGKAYLGDFKFVAEGNSYIRPINAIPMDDYLKGVVSYEMSNSWGNYGGLEALKAQAVAARTFALRYGNAIITDTQSHQVYGGYSWYAHTTRAVNETSGIVARYNGSLIEAFYSSSNGGKIFSNTNSWGSPLVPYLVSKDDPYDIRSVNKNVNWSFSLGKKQIDLALLDISNPSSWWNNQSELEADATELSNMKNYLQTNNYISNKYEMKITEITDITFDTAFATNKRMDGSIFFKYILRDKTTNQPGNDGFVMEDGKIKEHAFTFNSRNYTIRSLFGTTIMKSPYVKQVLQDEQSYTIQGGGWGHNIGMSQYGAYQMSKEGKSYLDILKFYYNAIALRDEMAPIMSETKATVNVNNLVSFEYKVDEETYITAKLINTNSKKETVISNNVKAKIGANNNSFDAFLLPGGSYQLHLTLKDNTGNVATETLNVNLNKLVSLEKVHTFLNIPTSTTLYESNSYESGKASGISPQNIVSTHKFGEWYMVNTWIGPKWLHGSSAKEIVFASVNKQIFLLEKVNLHELPIETTKTNYAVSPQSVKVTGEWNDWLRIETSIGPKWIKYKEQVETFIQKNVTLTERAALHGQPTIYAPTFGSVSPQVVKAIKKQGEWIQIETYIGPRWVESKFVFEGVLQSFQKDITVISKATLYKNPESDSIAYGGVAPQVVKAVQKTNGWIQINTYLGPKWIKEEHVIDGVSQTLNNYIQITTTSTLYTKPNLGFKTNLHVSPQKLFAIEKIGEWHKIKTWIGEQWILYK